MGCGSYGVFSKVCTEPGASPHTFDTSSEPWKFDVFTIGRRQKLVMQKDNTGSRSMLTQQVRQGPYLAFGDLRTRPSPADLDIWLPRILGGAESVDVFNPIESLATNGTFGVLASKEAGTEQIKDCHVSRAIWRGQAHDFEQEDEEPIEQILQIVGKEHVTGTSYPSLSFGTTAAYTPYIFAEGVLTINSASKVFYGFTLTVDNMLQVRYANGLFPTGLCPIGRRVFLDVDFQYTSANASDLFLYPDAGYSSATLVFTNGTVSTTFTFAVLKAASLSPVIQGPGEIVYRLRLIALKSGATNEIVVTNDAAV